MNPLIRGAGWPLGFWALLTISAPDARPDEEIAKPALKDLLGDPLPPGTLVRFGTHRFRQAQSTIEVAFHPDGTLIAAIDSLGRVGLWDAATGKPVAGPAIDASEHTFAFSPDGKWLATHENAGFRVEGGLRVWDLRGKGPFWVRNPLGIRVAKLAYSPCGRYVAAGGSGGSVFVYDVAARKVLHQLKGHRFPITAVAFSPDGSLLASGEGDGNRNLDTPILLWETARGRLLAKLEGHTNHISAVAFSPDGKTLVSSSLDKTLRFWDVAGRRLTRTIPHDARPVAFSPDGKLLATGAYFGRDGITVWDAATAKPLRSFARGMRVGDLAFSPDGKRLLSCGFYEGHALRVWEVATGEEVLAFEGHRHAVISLAFAPDGKTLATRGGDNTARLWDVATTRTTDHFLFYPTKHGFIGTGITRGPSRTLTFSLDGQTLACLGTPIGREVVVQLWDVPGRRLRQPIPVGRGPINALAFSPDGSDLAVASGWGTRLLSLPSGKELALLDAEPGVKRRFLEDLGIAFSPDGRTLAVSYFGRKICLWDRASRRLVRAIHSRQDIAAIDGIAYSPDGAVLASCISHPRWDKDKDPGAVRLWEAASGKLIAELDTALHHGVPCVAFSPDGRTLAIAQGTANTAQLWDLATGKPLATLRGHQGEVLCLAFSPDGDTLATGSADTTALLWDVRKYRPEPLPRPDAGDLPELWDRLRDEDPARAYPALWRLASAGDDAVALLRKHLRPAPAPDPERLRSLLKDLDSDAFKVRDEARQELVAIGEPAGPALRRLLEGKPPPEVRRLAEQVLEEIRAVADHGISLRELRAVSALGQVGTPAARALLEELAGGDGEATLTRRARAALRLTAGREGR